MVDNKPNDWMLLTMDNPNFDLPRFKEVGITPDNTSLQSRDFYKNNNYIRQQFSDPSTGKFDEIKFNNWYDNAAMSYNQFAQNQYEDDIYSDLEFDPMANLRPVGSKVKIPEIKIEKVSNPWRKKQNISRMGWIDDKEKSDLELASASKVFNTEIGKYEDYTADDMALFSNPIKFLDSIINPLVLATYDEDGYYTDPISGKQVWHNKGENKVNENGDFYFETLGNRSVYGKKVKSAFDSFTAESSTLNKYDFFDSDDLDKSITGTVFKTAMQLAPMFTPIAPYYGAAMVGKEMLNILPSVYNMTIGNFTNDTPEFINRLQGISKTLTSTTSQYSQDNFISFENILNLVADVSLQQQQQRTIFNWMSKLSGAKKQMSRISSLPVEEQAVEFMKFQDLVRKGNQTASNAALAYMAMSQGLDTYYQGLELGLSKPEAAITAWGAIVGMYAIDKKGLGETFFPELDMGEAAARNEARKLTKRFAEPFDNIKGPTSKNKLVKLWNSAKNKSFIHWSEKDNITGFWDAVKTHSLNFMGKTIGEGLEESAEEAVSDLSKSIMNLWLEYTDKRDKDNKPIRFDIWEDMLERQAMNFFGGAIGGAVFAGAEIVNGTRLSRQSKQELAYLIRNGQTGMILDQLENLRKKGKCGNKNLSIKDPLKMDDGTLVWQHADSIEDNQNEAVYRATKAYILALDKAIHQGGFDLSDKDILKKMSTSSQRLDILLDKDIIQKGYAHRILDEYQKLQEQYINLIEQQAKLDLTDKDIRTLEKVKSVANTSNISLSEASKSNDLKLTLDEQQKIEDYDRIQKELEDVKKKRDDFFSGEYAIEFLDSMLFEMDEVISQAFYDPTFDLWVMSTKGKELSDFSEEQQKSLKEEYTAWKNSEDSDKKRAEAFEMFKLYNKKFAPQINAQINVQNKVEQLNKYLRENLYDMRETLGDDPELVQGENIAIGKYRLPIAEEFKFEDADHIDSVDEMLRTKLGLDTRFVLKDEFRLRSKLEEVPYILDPNLTPEENAVKRADNEKLNEQIKKWNDSLDEHNKKVFDNIVSLVEKIKEFGFIDLDTKNYLLQLLNSIIHAAPKEIIPQSDIENNLAIAVIENKDFLDYDKFETTSISDYIPFKSIINELLSFVHLNDKDLQNKIKEIVRPKVKVLDREGLIKLLNDKEFNELWEDIEDHLIRFTEDSEESFIIEDEEGNKTLSDDLSDNQVFIIWNSIYDTLDMGYEDAKKYVDDKYKQDFNRGSEKFTDLLSKVIYDTISNNKSEKLSIYKTVYNDIATQESPLYDFISKLSVAMFGKKLNIFEFLRSQDSVLTQTQHIQEYVLGQNAALELEQAKKVLKMMQSLIVASRNEEDAPELLIGHNAIVKEFAKENGLTNDYETLPAEKAFVFLEELSILNSKLSYLEGLNQLNSANQFKEQTNTEKQAIKLLTKAFLAEQEFQFLKKLTVNIDDKEYNLLDGISGIIPETIGEDLDADRKLLTTMQLKLHENLQKIADQTKKSKSEILGLMLDNIDPSTLQTIAKQTTTSLNSKTKTIEIYDALMFVLTSSLYNKHEFEYRLKEALSDSENIAPLFTQQWSIYLGSALIKFKEEFRTIMSKIHAKREFGYQELLNDLIFIDGVGGAGKTSVVGNIIYKIAKKDNPKLKILKCGPTKQQLEGLSHVIPNGENKTKDQFLLELLGKQQYDEILSEINSPYKDTNKYIIRETVKDASGQKTIGYKLNLDNITFQKLDYDLVIFDEGSFLNQVELKLMSQSGVVNNFTSIIVGDTDQQYPFSENLGVEFANISYVDSVFCMRTPRLGINMRVQCSQKKDNSEVAGNMLHSYLNISGDNPLKVLRDNAFFHYFEDNNKTLYGDKMVDNISQEDLKQIIQSAIEHSNDKDKPVLGYIWDGQDSEVKRNLDSVLDQNPAFKNRVLILSPEEVQGSEFDQVIVDVKFSFVSKIKTYEELKQIYTFSTRAKVGVRFLNKGLSNFLSYSNFVSDIRTDLSPDASIIIQNYKEAFFKYLDDSLQGYTPPKVQESTKESQKQEEKVVNSELDDTFEEEIQIIKHQKKNNPDDSKQFPDSIRSYAWYIRYGTQENDGKQQKVEYNGEYSDLNVILDVTNSDTATDEQIQQFLQLKETLSSGLIDYDDVQKDLKENVFDSEEFEGFVDSIASGKYYIEARKTDLELDKPQHLFDGDVSQITESINIVYRFQHKGTWYQITLSKLSKPETWRENLPDDADTTDVDLYEKQYNEYLRAIQESSSPILYELDKDDLEFSQVGRIIPFYDNEQRMVFNLDEYTKYFPMAQLSTHLYIYDGPDDGGALNSSLRGTRCIQLIAPLYGRAWNNLFDEDDPEYDGTGKWVKITPDNMHELYSIAKKRQLNGKKSRSPIRAFVCDSKPQYFFDPINRNTQVKRTAFLGQDIKQLMQKYGQNEKIVWKHLSTQKTATTYARVLVSLWNYMVELRHCLKLKNEGNNIDQINSYLINQSSIFRIIEQVQNQTSDASKVFVGPMNKNNPNSPNVLYMDMSEVYNYFDILCTLFDQLEGLIDFPGNITIDQVKDLDYGKTDGKHIGRMSMQINRVDPTLPESERRENSSTSKVISEKLRNANLKNIEILDEDKLELSVYDVSAILQVFFVHFNKWVEGKGMLWAQSEQQQESLSVTDEKTGTLITAKPSVLFSKFQEIYPGESSQGFKRANYEAKKFFNLLLFGTIDPDSETSLQVTVEREYNGSSYRVIPFPEGIYCRPIYQDVGLAKGIYLFQAFNEQDQFMVDSGFEPGTINIRPKANIKTRHQKQEIVPKFSIGQVINYNGQQLTIVGILEDKYLLKDSEQKDVSLKIINVNKNATLISLTEEQVKLQKYFVDFGISLERIQSPNSIEQQKDSIDLILNNGDLFQNDNGSNFIIGKKSDGSYITILDSIKSRLNGNTVNDIRKIELDNGSYKFEIVTNIGNYVFQLNPENDYVENFDEVELIIEPAIQQSEEQNLEIIQNARDFLNSIFGEDVNSDQYGDLYSSLNGLLDQLEIVLNSPGDFESKLPNFERLQNGLNLYIGQFQNYMKDVKGIRIRGNKQLQNFKDIFDKEKICNFT